MKKSVISALAAIGAGALLLTSRKTIHRSLDAVTRRNDDPMRKLMVYLMMPAWLGGGLVDYLLHRRSKIETTSGFSEALIHSAMMTEVAPVILAGLFPGSQCGRDCIDAGGDCGARRHGDLGHVLHDSSPRDRFGRAAHPQFARDGSDLYHGGRDHHALGPVPFSAGPRPGACQLSSFDGKIRGFRRGTSGWFWARWACWARCRTWTNCDAAGKREEWAHR